MIRPKIEIYQAGFWVSFWCSDEDMKAFREFINNQQSREFAGGSK